jgi:hypothetical protein
MLDRLLFAVRGLRVGRWLGSWKLSIVLMLLAGLYHGFLAIWSFSSPSHVVQNIAALAPFWLVYGLILVSTAVCLWNRIGLLKRHVSPLPLQVPPDWKVETRPEIGQQEMSHLFRVLGYKPSSLEPGRLWGVRRRWSGLGAFLFHGAFGLLAIGFLFTLAARHEAKVWIAAGEEFSAQPEQFLSQSPPRILSSGVPAMAFQVERITPEFWRDELLFTTLEADIVLPGSRRVTTRINRPLWWDWCTFLRLSGFGYAARYQIVNRRGVVLDSAFVKLNVFPPGQRDFLNIPGYPHRFYVELLPDFIEEQQPVTRSLNLAKPAVVLRVLRGKIDLGGAVLLRGDGFTFEGLTIGFPEVRHWGEFTIVRDPGAPVVFAGYLLGLSGLVLGMGGKRSELAWQGSPEKRGFLQGWGLAKPERVKQVGVP